MELYDVMRTTFAVREFTADFALVPDDAPLPPSEFPSEQRDRDLGWMLHDIDHAGDRSSRFFRARLRDEYFLYFHSLWVLVTLYF